ncbi:MAG: 4-(cytidine 5'-diphospho)-2-C-methyl-D-erythritol kinase [Gemmataceae bacterium]|nr:4-(cytidine 5'-diphospho)-2-C-methyl-D-erythritol kinase [Gemmataceae bacterium]
MRLLEQRHEVVVWAPAKVNLFLEVLGKRPDGYHAIATLLLAIRRFDTLGIREDHSGAIQLHCNRSDLSTGPDNLVVRAARLLQERTGCPRGCRLRLIKRIPMAAGLAGGSSDAAATLLGLNRLWQLELANSDLEKLGAELGSDVPFFFHLPAAWCTGRGEIVTPVAFPRALDLVLVCPSFGCPTAAVYGWVQAPEEPLDGQAMLAAAAIGDVEAIGRQLHNRLQPAAMTIAPRLAEFVERVEALRPAGTLMSGSGSTVYAVCRDRVEASRIAKELRKSACGDFAVHVVRSCSAQLPP